MIPKSPPIANEIQQLANSSTGVGIKLKLKLKPSVLVLISARKIDVHMDPMSPWMANMANDMVEIGRCSETYFFYK